MNASDSELLQQFVRDGSEGAFTELVHRHVNLVYSAAMRQVGPDVSAAADVTQSVFTDLARKARQLTRHPTLTGWLYSSTRLAAAQQRRSESRRLARETAAHAMSQLLSSDASEPDWNRLRPVLDEAMHDLNEADRQAVLLRFFEQRPLSEIGARLGLSENTARMRVERALDKLHAALTKRGITSTTAALGATLAAHAVGAVPVGLVERIAPAARSGAATAAAGGVVPGKLMLAALALLLGIGALMWTSRRAWNGAASTGAPTDHDRNSVAADASAGGPEIAPRDGMENAAAGHGPAATQEPASISADASGRDNAPALTLTFLTRDSGRPVPNVIVNYRGWEGSHFTKRSIAGTRQGEATVRVLPGTTRLELITVAEGFADTKLRWVPERGDTIPTNYTVRMEHAAWIGGTVVDPEGRPVAGAKVGWNHIDDGLDPKGTESREFDWIEVESDAAGRWQIHRVAESMLERLTGGATHPEFQPAEHVGHHDWPGREALVKQLRNQTHVFQLKASGQLQGIVLNEAGEPLAGATVLVGRKGFVGSRESKTEPDGTFEVRGTELGTTPITAEAEGYASRTVQLTLTRENAPVRLVLGPGTPLRLRLVNQAGAPVSQAYVWLNTMDRSPQTVRAVTTLLQAAFDGRSDDEGRVVWEDAPPGEHHFDIEARGYLRTNHVAIPADGREHVVMLPPALVVQGRVTDANTGRPVPRFRLVLGWPRYDPAQQRTTAQFSSIDRFALDFTGGTYRHSVEEQVIEGTGDPRLVIQFEAEGYLPHLSRPLRYDEGVVTLDVALEVASEIEVTVVDPAGRVASGAHVGLVFPGAALKLSAGRLTTDSFSRTGALKQADGQGLVKLVDDPKVARLIFAHPTGYLETSFAALEADGFARLQTWGRIEGEFLGPTGSREGKLVRVFPWELRHGDLDFDFTAATEGNGRFLFPQVPPGPVRVGHWIVTDLGNGSSSATSGQMVEATVISGEGIQVTLGGGYRVSGRLQLPAGFTAPPGAYWMAVLHTPFPEPPAEIRNDPTALQQWFQTPEMKELASQAKQVPVALQPDGSFAADSVSEGNYRLSIALIPLAGPQSDGVISVTPLLTAKHDLTIPSEPAVGELQLGVIATEVPSGAP